MSVKRLSWSAEVPLKKFESPIFENFGRNPRRVALLASCPHSQPLERPTGNGSHFTVQSDSSGRHVQNWSSNGRTAGRRTSFIDIASIRSNSYTLLSCLGKPEMILSAASLLRPSRMMCALQFGGSGLHLISCLYWRKQQMRERTHVRDDSCSRKRAYWLSQPRSDLKKDNLCGMRLQSLSIMMTS